MELIGSRENVGPKEKAYLEKVLARWQVFANQQSDDVRSREIRAEACERVAFLYFWLGQHVKAQTLYETAKDLRRQLVEQFPSVPEYQIELANTHNNLGIVLSDLGDSVGARSEYEAAKQIWCVFSSQFPAVPKYQSSLANVHNNLAVLLDDLGETAPAKAEYISARNIFQGLAAQFTTQSEHQSDLAISHGTFGNHLKNQGEPTLAHSEFESARNNLRELVAKFPDVLEYRTNLGGNYCDTGRLVASGGDLEASLDWFRQAIELLALVHESAPHNFTARRFLRNSYQARAEALLSLRRNSEALADIEHAAKLSTAAENRFGAFLLRANLGLRLSQVARPLAEAPELVRLDGATRTLEWTGEDWFNAPCLYSQASGELPDQSKRYSDRAMELLKAAIEGGYNTPEATAQMATDAALDPLRERDDFKQLLESLPKAPDPAADPSSPADSTQPQP